MWALVISIVAAAFYWLNIGDESGLMRLGMALLLAIMTIAIIVIIFAGKVFKWLDRKRSLITRLTYTSTKKS